jgi:ectoine hydroxylase-related dioxygenase (phytanoyl-CoA dioxygenase family)
MHAIRDQFEASGFAIVRSCVGEEILKALETATDASQHGVRNLLSNKVVRRIAGSDEVRAPVKAVLGVECFAVRGIFFNKNPEANWKVAWHQDCVIAVCEKLDIGGWGPWSSKGDVVHVRPVAIRIHLDDCGDDNGPLRVIPGSHREGFLSDIEIQSRSKDDAVTCSVLRGDAILLRPLILHSSPSATRPSNRRVVHLEFAAAELPHGARWQDQV